MTAPSQMVQSDVEEDSSVQTPVVHESRIRRGCPRVSIDRSRVSNELEATLITS